jgi:hypothetical protein
MSKKKNRTGNSSDIIKNIGERLSGEKENNSSSDNKNTVENEEKDKSNDIEKESSDSDNKEDKIKSKENNTTQDEWNDEQKPYRSSFIIKPDMEDDFDSCKKIFRKQFRMNLSKQNAIELGWLLLKNLDDKYYEKVKETSSPDDDLIKELKKVINEYF